MHGAQDRSEQTLDVLKMRVAQLDISKLKGEDVEQAVHQSQPLNPSVQVTVASRRCDAINVIPICQVTDVVSSKIYIKFLTGTHSRGTRRAYVTWKLGMFLNRSFRPSRPKCVFRGGCQP